MLSKKSCLLILLLVLILSGCSPLDEKTDPIDMTDRPIINNLWTVTDGITLRLEKDSYPPGTKCLTVTIENRTEFCVYYGYESTYEKYKDGQWYDYKPEVYGFSSLMIFTCDEYTTDSFTFYFTALEEEGHYRVTGCELRVAPFGTDYFDATAYPPYQFEFFISNQL